MFPRSQKEAVGLLNAPLAAFSKPQRGVNSIASFCKGRFGVEANALKRSAAAFFEFSSF